MKRDFFINHIRELIREYNTRLRMAKKGAKEEPVHDLRVMIKRLNALFLFLDESGIYKKKPKAFFHDLKGFFRAAGNLRDIHVMIALFNDYRNQYKDDLSEFETYLVNKESIAKSGFIRRASEYPRQKQNKVIAEIIRSVNMMEEEVLRQRSFDFMIKRLNRIKKYLLQTDTDKYLHKIRQTLKQLRYFIEIFHSSSRSFLIEQSDFVEIKEMESIIGGWNDRNNLVEEINKFNSYKHKLGIRTPDPALTRLINILKRKKKEMVRYIKPRLIKFIYHLKYSIP